MMHGGAVIGPPLLRLIDLPLLPGESEAAGGLKIAVWTKPWRSQAIFLSPSSNGFAQRGTVTAPATVGVLVNALDAGETGRFDRKNVLTVRLLGGELAGQPDAQILNGGNSALVKCVSGGWEIIQFQEAVEVSAGVWQLFGLLRGQLGTEDAMLAGAAARADFVLLNSAVSAAGLNASEIGIELNWRAGPVGKDFSVDFFSAQTAAGGVRALTPLSPVHLKKKAQADGTIQFSWVRRSRIDADSWLGADVPLGEAEESYRIRLVNEGGAVVREASVSAPLWAWTPSMQAADAGFLPVALEAAQMSEAIGAGVPARVAL